MKKSFSKVFFLQVIFFCLVVFTTCIKREREMKVTMGEVTSISTNSAVISVAVIDLGEGTFKACGLCWSTAINPTLNNDKTTVGSGKGNFTNNLSGLLAGTKYYVRPYLTTSVGTLIGEGIVITTKDFPSVISTDPVNNANNVVLNKAITTTFSQPMNPTTIAISTFTLNQGATAVNGTVTYSGTTATFTPSNNLIPGATYTVTITTGAKNTDGIALLNNYVWNFTTAGPPTVPGVPTGVSATKGDAQATVTFTAPVSNGGSPITGYTVTSSPGSIIGTGPASPITVAGLTNGTPYTFTVTATNGIGTGPASSPSNSVIPSTVPGAPTGVSAIKGNAQATVSFTAPTSNGGSAITGYTVTFSPGNIIGTGPASPITVTGLTNGTTYTFTVIATNANGNSSPSPVGSITPSTVPGAPTIGIAIAGNTQATVSFNAPTSNGGSAITGYTVTSSPGGFTGTGSTSPITVTGLTNGTTYTFTVTATNINGPGPASSSSNSITPFPTVTIGTQVWMAENLNTTKYNDGTAILNYTDNATWIALTSGAYCDYDNTPVNSTIYGRMYNWYVVDPTNPKKICPVGWHVPSDPEWTVLINYAGGLSEAGGNLKDTGYTYWDAPNSGATNLYGFTARGGGDRNGNSGIFINLKINGYWWSSTDDITGGGTVAAGYSGKALERGFVPKTFGQSVRCLKD